MPQKQTAKVFPDVGSGNPLPDDKKDRRPREVKGRRTQPHAFRTVGNDLRSLMSIRPLLTIHDAAIRLNCSQRTVWRYIQQGEMRAVRFGRSTRITEEDLQAFINRHRS